jgi:diguanylate cyclase (GGDEF)-like protein
MKPLFWVAINFIGFIILVFMYINTDKKHADKSPGRRLFGVLQLVIMLFLIFDTAAYMIEGQASQAAFFFHYAFNLFYYVTIPLPGLIYLFYCDYKVYGDTGGNKKRFSIYSVPVVLNALIVISTPFTQAVFHIDGHNMYMRGDFHWVTLLVAFGYVFASYPLLALKTRKKRALPPEGADVYFYLFPFPPLVFAIVQLLNVGILLIGMGFVISAYFMYTSAIQSSEDKRRLSVRFHNAHIMQFAVVAFVMIAGMLWVLDNVIDEISQDYAVYESTGTANDLKSYLNKEIGVLGAAAHSTAVIDWFGEEDDPDKSRVAFEELTSILRVLYNDNLYIVVEESRNAYAIERGSALKEFAPPKAVNEDDPENEWYFAFMASPEEYNLNVDVDNILGRKAVWLNYKVRNEDGGMTGALTAGMDFSQLAGQAFSRYNDTKTRVFIIDENGVIQMDSALLGEEDFLHFGITKTITEEVPDSGFRAAIRAHLDGIGGYFQELCTESAIIELHMGQYQYATITPIGTTSWSVVTLFDSSSLFSRTRLLPPFLIITAMFVLFVFSSNRIARRMIFTPLRLLVESLRGMRQSGEHEIYGMERDDEIGLLSNTIHDFFVTGYYDGLTGIYNRRYMEITLKQVMASLSRTRSSLSVLMLDVDFFKKYNDAYGHGQGDECLKTVANALNTATVRCGDFVARYGGEEFVAVLPGTDEEGARIVAEKMLQAVRDLKIPHEQNGGGFVTISAGIATGDPVKPYSRDDYLNKADEALYMSKQNGRNRYTFLALTGED